MLYLLLAILCSSLITILMRLSETRRKNNLSMLAVNYAACSLLALLFAGPTQLFPAVEGLRFTLLLGALGSVLYLGGFLLLQWNIARNGVVLPATFMKLGVLVPTLTSIFVFGENPRAVQLVGVAAAVIAIPLMQGGGASKQASSLLGLILLLLCGGFADGLSKIFEQIGPAELRNHFLLYNFIMAFVLSSALCIFKRQSLTLADAAFGMLIGIPNYLASRFLLLSLSHVPAVVAFPSFSVGAILLTVVAGVVLFHEKLNRRKCVALVIILLALVLLNL